MKDHRVLMGESIEFSQPFSPEYGRGRAIAYCMFNAINDTELLGRLKMVGKNGTVIMKGLPYWVHCNFRKALQ